MTKFFSKTLSFIKSVRGLSILIGLTVVSTGAVLAFKDDLNIFKSKEDFQSKTGIEKIWLKILSLALLL